MDRISHLGTVACSYAAGVVSAVVATSSMHWPTGGVGEVLAMSAVMLVMAPFAAFAAIFASSDMLGAGVSDLVAAVASLLGGFGGAWVARRGVPWSR